jgi:hypothetical protein
MAGEIYRLLRVDVKKKGTVLNQRLGVMNLAVESCIVVENL